MFVRRRLVVASSVAVLVTSAAAAYAAASAPGAGSSAQGAAALQPELPASVIAASFGARSHWRPEKAFYGTTSDNDVPVTMR